MGIIPQTVSLLSDPNSQRYRSYFYSCNMGNWDRESTRETYKASSQWDKIRALRGHRHHFPWPYPGPYKKKKKIKGRQNLTWLESWLQISQINPLTRGLFFFHIRRICRQVVWYGEISLLNLKEFLNMWCPKMSLLLIVTRQRDSEKIVLFC